MINLKIDGVNEESTQYGNRVTITSGKNKFRFYAKKQDGNETKAYSQFKKYGFKTGDTVSCEVEEKPDSFVDQKTGKTVNYTKRTIKFFQEIENVPVVQQAPKGGLSLEDKVNILWEERANNKSYAEELADQDSEVPF